MGRPDGPASTEDVASSGDWVFRPEIQGLRAIAILAVLLFTIGLPHADGGFIGIDVFFVISGFLVTGLLLREGEETGRIDLVRFYARRIRRLLPVALTVIVVTLAASALIVTSLRLEEISGDAVAAALYVANLRFALDAVEFVAVEASSPLLHYWPLAAGEQVYLVWPLLLLLATRILSRRFVGIFIVILAAASFALSLYWTEAEPAWAFYSPVTRAWELAAGALVAIGLLRVPRRAPRGTGAAAVLLGLVLIVVSVVVITAEVPFPGLAVLLPVLGAVLVILGGSSGGTLPGRLLGNPLFRYLGRISYSLYLWHWPILILVPIAIDSDELSVSIALAGVAILAAAVSTELIERPFRGSAALSARSWGSVRLGLTASVAVAAAALFVSGAISIPAISLGPDRVEVDLAGVRADTPRTMADGCQLRLEAKKIDKSCVYGDPEGTETAYLLGDARAAQWFPALEAYAAQQGWRLEVHTKDGCSVLPVPLWERDLQRVYDECHEWRAAVMKRMKRNPPEVVFVGSAGDYALWDSGRVLQSRDATSYWQERMRALLESLGDRAGRVFLLAETPTLTYDPVDCLSERDPDCDLPRSLVVDSEYEALEQAAADAAGAALLSINDILCPDRHCRTIDGEMVVFRDPHHLTASYMAHLAEPIANLLEGRPAYPSPSPSAGASPA